MDDDFTEQDRGPRGEAAGVIAEASQPGCGHAGGIHRHDENLFCCGESTALAGVFGPEDISLMQGAFDDAWRRVQVSNAPYGAEEYASAGRAILASHIIRAAKAGERDPRSLASANCLMKPPTTIASPQVELT